MVAIYLSIVYALLYMLFTIYPIVFQEHRGWNSGVGALPLIGTMVGACIAGAIVFYESTFGKKKMLAGIPRKPEDRMPLVSAGASRGIKSRLERLMERKAMIGGVLFPITMFAFAWSANFNSVHWVVPTIVSGTPSRIRCRVLTQPLSKRQECFFQLLSF